MDEYAKFKINKVIYNIFDTVLPTSGSTYKSLLDRIDFTKTSEANITKLTEKLEKVYITPDNISQVLFIFLGPLQYYSDISKAMLSEWNEFSAKKKNFSKFLYLAKFKQAFGDNFLIEWGILDARNNYLFAKAIILDENFSKLNTIEEIESIICSSISTKITKDKFIKTSYNRKLDPNKIVLYGDCYIDDIMLDNVTNFILGEFKDNNSDMEDFGEIMGYFNIPSILIEKLISTYGELSLEKIPEILKNPIIIELIRVYLRFRPLIFQKFSNPPNKFTINKNCLNSYIPAYLENNSVYNFYDDIPTKSKKILGSMTNKNTFYMYNYNNISHFYKKGKEDILNMCFPFRTRKQIDKIENNILLGVEKSNIDDGIQFNKIYLADIENINILSLEQHPLIYLFNNTILSLDVPFSKFNDLQGDDEIYKVYKPIIRRETDLYRPIVRKELLENWCAYNYSELNYDNLNKLQPAQKGRRKKNLLRKIPQTYNKTIILSFKLKIGYIHDTKFLNGSIYNFNTDEKGIRISVNILRNFKIHRNIKEIYTDGKTKIKLRDLAINQTILFKNIHDLYCDILFKNIETNGRIMVNVQIDTFKYKDFNVLHNSETYLQKINQFLNEKIFSNKFYTERFIISYTDFNTNFSDMIPFNTTNLYKVSYHFIINSDKSCINILQKPNGELFHNDIAWTKIINILKQLEPFIKLNDEIKKFNLGDEIMYNIEDNASITNLSDINDVNPNETWINGVVDEFADSENSYNIRLINDKIISNVDYSYLKRNTKQPIRFLLRDSANLTNTNNNIILDYHKKYNITSSKFGERYKIDCIVLGCTSYLIKEYIQKILNFTIAKYNEISEESVSSPITTSPSLKDETLIEMDEEGEDLDWDTDSDEGDITSNSEEDESLSSSEDEEGDDENDEEDSKKSKEVDILESVASSGKTIKHIKLKIDKIERFENLFLNRLYSYDKELFKWEKEIDGRIYNGFSKMCQSERQPKVLSQGEKDAIDKRDEKVGISSYGFKSEQKDCEYQSDKDGYSERKVLFDGKTYDERDASKKNPIEKSYFDKIQMLNSRTNAEIKKLSKKRFDYPNVKCKAIKYGSSKENKNWYICPRLYDKQSNTPLHWSLLDYDKLPDDKGEERPFEPEDYEDEDKWRIDKHTKLDIEDYNPRYPKLKNSQDGMNRPIWVYPKIGVSNGKAYFYPGFLDYKKHPISEKRIPEKEPLYPPCCFQTNSKRFNNLMVIQHKPDNKNYIQNEPITKNSSYNYIGIGSLGALPESLGSLFNQTISDAINSNSSKTRKNKTGVFFRFGINQGDEAFLTLICDIFKISHEETTIGRENTFKKIKAVKEIIIKSISARNDSDKIYFSDINNGFLDILFRKSNGLTSFQNFKEYVMSPDFKRYDLFYEILTSMKNNTIYSLEKPTALDATGPKYIIKKSIKGLILIIFNMVNTKDGIKINIECPHYSTDLKNNIADYSHVAMAIRFNKLFEPIYYRRFGNRSTSDKDVHVFKVEDIYKESYGADEQYLGYIKNILEKFKGECMSSSKKLNYNFTGKKKITFSTIKTFIKNSLSPDISLFKFSINNNDNKVYGAEFKFSNKIYSIPIFPENITQDELDDFTINPVAKGLLTISDKNIPSFQEYKQFFKKIQTLSSNLINIHPIKYFGIIQDINDDDEATITLKGFGVSFISNSNSYPNIDKTLIYFRCKEESNFIVEESKISYNYAEIDKYIFTHKISVNPEPNQPVNIITIADIIKSLGKSFKIKNLFKDDNNDRIVLIQTKKNLFIPIQPVEKTFFSKQPKKSNLLFKNIAESIFSPDSSSRNTNMKQLNPAINISEDLEDYCKKINIFSKNISFRAPIFIRNFNINTANLIDTLYIDSGLVLQNNSDEIIIKPFTIKVINRESIFATNVDSSDYVINLIKNNNLNFLTQKDIIDNNLPIIYNYEDVNSLKFNYDLHIYDAVIKKLNIFFSVNNNIVVKKIKSFLVNLFNNSNKIHTKIKKKLCYPIIFRILDIIIAVKKEDEENLEYPVINIDLLTNLESEDIIILENIKADIKNYIKKSYNLISYINDADADNVETISDLLADKNEYKNAMNLDYVTANKLYSELTTEFNSKPYTKLNIINSATETGKLSRSEFLKHKIANNIVTNSFIQGQIFNIYEPNRDNQERFRFNIYDELLFTKNEIENYSKLDKHYKVVKQKYYNSMTYPELKIIKPSKIYKFKYSKIKLNRIPFRYSFKKII